MTRRYMAHPQSNRRAERLDAALTFALLLLAFAMVAFWPQ